MNSPAGQLYVVSTPIGNMGDITYRAVETLSSADVIYSEDTRETAKILTKYNITTPQKIYTDQKHTYVFEEIKQLLDAGRNIALVSDSGTPLISDPGYKLVTKLRDNGYTISSIPGPSAVIAALSVSGLPTDQFVFLGFLPKKQAARTSLLNQYLTCEATLTIYESPYRLKRLLPELTSLFGNRTAVVVKDITKQFELIQKGKLADLSSFTFKEKGEYIVLVAKEGI